MRKSTIWLLAVVMAFAFAGLLYLQVNYVSIILKTRSEQFNETVKRSLRQVSKNLELDETRKYLEDDINRDETNFMYQNAPDAQSLGQVINHEKYQLQIKDSNGTVQQIEMQSFSAHKFEPLSSLSKRQSANSIVNTSKDLQKTLKRRYQYQGGLIEEVIYNILYTANLKPIEERIDFKKLNNYLKTEFINNGLNLPFVFSVINKDGNVVYQSGEFQKQPIASDVITQVLFPNDPPSKLNYLRVYFPTKGDYISRASNGAALFYSAAKSQGKANKRRFIAFYALSSAYFDAKVCRKARRAAHMNIARPRKQDFISFCALKSIDKLTRRFGNLSV